MKWISVRDHLPRDICGKIETIIVLIKEVERYYCDWNEITTITTRYKSVLGYHYARIHDYSSRGSTSGPKNGWRGNDDNVYFEDEDQDEGITQEITHWIYWHDLPTPDGCDFNQREEHDDGFERDITCRVILSDSPKPEDKE